MSGRLEVCAARMSQGALSTQIRRIERRGAYARCQAIEERHDRVVEGRFICVGRNRTGETSEDFNVRPLHSYAPRVAELILASGRSSARPGTSTLSRSRTCHRVPAPTARKGTTASVRDIHFDLNTELKLTSTRLDIVRAFLRNSGTPDLRTSS